MTSRNVLQIVDTYEISDFVIVLRASYGTTCHKTREHIFSARKETAP